MSSCKQDNTNLLPSSNGKTNNILLIMNDKDWKTDLGDTIRKYFATEFPDLPQEEPMFTLHHASPELFTGSFKKYRTIMIIKEGDENKVEFIHDKYAKPQLIIVIEGKNKKEIKKLIAENAKKITDTIYNFEINIIQQRHKKSLRDNSDIEKELGISIEIPNFFVLVDHRPKFFWFRRDVKNGEQDILLYEVPLKGNLSLQKAEVTKYRDSIGKKYIPGPVDSTYMKTVKGISPSQNEVMINEIKAIETRGLWNMENDFMGGPYINYSLIDKKNNRVVVGEGFIYAPALDKRDYMVQLEAILKTMKLKN
jgi:hypothetical protein